jgi:hypothetical protein
MDDEIIGQFGIGRFPGTLLDGDVFPDRCTSRGAPASVHPLDTDRRQRCVGDDGHDGPHWDADGNQWARTAPASVAVGDA